MVCLLAPGTEENASSITRRSSSTSPEASREEGRRLIGQVRPQETEQETIKLEGAREPFLRCCSIDDNREESCHGRFRTRVSTARAAVVRCGILGSPVTCSLVKQSKPANSRTPQRPKHLGRMVIVQNLPPAKRSRRGLNGQETSWFSWGVGRLVTNPGLDRASIHDCTDVQYRGRRPPAACRHVKVVSFVRLPRFGGIRSSTRERRAPRGP